MSKYSQHNAEECVKVLNTPPGPPSSFPDHLTDIVQVKGNSVDGNYFSHWELATLRDQQVVPNIREGELPRDRGDIHSKLNKG